MWFNRHLNLSLLFAWIIENIFAYVSISQYSEHAIGEAEYWIILAQAIVVFIGTEVWYLLRKKRSLFFLFLNLASWIGLIFLLQLDNNRAPCPTLQAKPTDNM